MIHRHPPVTTAAAVTGISRSWRARRSSTWAVVIDMPPSRASVPPPSATRPCATPHWRPSGPPGRRWPRPGDAWPAPSRRPTRPGASPSPRASTSMPASVSIAESSCSMTAVTMLSTQSNICIAYLLDSSRPHMLCSWKSACRRPVWTIRRRGRPSRRGSLTMRRVDGSSRGCVGPMGLFVRSAARAMRGRPVAGCGCAATAVARRR